MYSEKYILAKSITRELSKWVVGVTFDDNNLSYILKVNDMLMA